MTYVLNYPQKSSTGWEAWLLSRFFFFVDCIIAVLSILLSVQCAILADISVLEVIYIYIAHHIVIQKCKNWKKFWKHSPLTNMVKTEKMAIHIPWGNCMWTILSDNPSISLIEML